MQLAINTDISSPGRRIIRQGQTNPQLAKALDNVPGWREPLTQLDHLKDQVASLPDPPTQADLELEVRRELASGEFDPAKAAARHEAIANAWQSRNGFKAMLEQIGQGLSAQSGAIVEQHLDDLLTSLNEQVAAAVSDYTTHKDAPEAAEALERSSKDVDAWRRRKDAEERYCNIRVAQRLIVTIITERDVDVNFNLTEYGYIRNSPDLWGDSRDHIAFLAGVPKRNGEFVRYSPYPGERAGDLDWLAWIADNPKAEVWVPTLTQLRDSKAETSQLRAKHRPTTKAGRILHHI